MTLTVLKNTSQVYFRMPSPGICLPFFFSIIRLRWWVLGEENHRGKVSFSPHHIKGTCCLHDSLPMMLALIMWPRCVYRVSAPQSYPSLFHALIFGRRSLCAAMSSLFTLSKDTHSKYVLTLSHSPPLPPPWARPPSPTDHITPGPNPL